MKPSYNWLNNLILVIQECEAETGQNFGEFLDQTFGGLPRSGTTNYQLSQALKNKFDLEGRRRESESDMWPEKQTEPSGERTVQMELGKSSPLIMTKRIAWLIGVTP